MAMRRFLYYVSILVSLAAVRSLAASDFVLVDEVGNPPHPELGRGTVNYKFYIATTEVTNSEYVVFLNTVDPTGINPNAIYDPSMEVAIAGGITFDQSAPIGHKYHPKENYANKPVTRVTLVMAMQYCNWLHNGSIAGGTECGAYDLTGDVIPRRSPGARYFLPNVDEFLKSAYFSLGVSCGDGPWTRFATGCDDAPTPAIANSVGDVVNPGPNVATYDSAAHWGGVNDGFFTTVGSCGAQSYFHTYDQTGNVTEWVEEQYNGHWASLGGNYKFTELQLDAPGFSGTPGFPTGSGTTGFRVAKPFGVPGDGNSDGIVDGGDLQAYVSCLLAGGDDCGPDISQFVSILVGGTCN